MDGTKRTDNGIIGVNLGAGLGTIRTFNNISRLLKISDKLLILKKFNRFKRVYINDVVLSTTGSFLFH